MRNRLALALCVVAVAACDMGKITVSTTAKVLVRAQPSLQMESDYEAARLLSLTFRSLRYRLAKYGIGD